jgi:Zn-dependent M28 family amino/carboxypeptidase
MKRAIAASVLLLIPIAASLCQSPANGPRIEANRISAHVKILASDDFQGRAPASAGEKKTIDYIISQFQAEHISPGGDPDGSGGRKWTQDVPLSESEITEPVTVTLKAGGQTKTLRQGDDIAVRATYLPVEHVSIVNAPLIFVGYGVKAPERQWDDFKGVNLRGKIAVVLINDPDFEADLGGRFEGKAMTWYGRWTYKYEEAARQGALGMLVVHESAPASYGWATVKNSNTNTMFDIRRARPADVHPLLEAWIQRPIAEDLFHSGGLDFDAEKKKAQSPDFHPVALRGAMLSVAYRAKHSEIVSHNVLGIVKGTKHPDETVIYSAHWDHLGIGLPDERGDRIYNGARDNAVGVASLLEIARLYASSPAPERTVVFLSVTAEEKGLLGSEYYATHPLYPLALTAAVYNTDGGNVTGPTHDVSLSGDGKVSLQRDLATAAEGEGRHFSPDDRPEAGSFYRSDHFSFAKAGVPAISFKSGIDKLDGGVKAGKMMQDENTAKRYHQPADEWSETWDLRGAVQDDELLYRLGRAIADSRTWPGWLEGSEFKSIRDKTHDQRK